VKNQSLVQQVTQRKAAFKDTTSSSVQLYMAMHAYITCNNLLYTNQSGAVAWPHDITGRLGLNWKMVLAAYPALRSALMGGRKAKVCTWSCHWLDLPPIH